MPHQHDQQAIADLFARHMDAEFTGDLETTLAAMTDNPHLVNVPSMAGGADREEVRAFCAGHLANFKTPRRIYLVDKLPYHTAANGSKLQRHVLREWARERAEAQPG